MEHSVITGFLIFIVLSAVAATFSRATFGIYGAAAPRYVLLPALFLSLLYISSVNTGKKIKPWLLILILLFSIQLYRARVILGFEMMSAQKEKISDGMLSWYINPDSTTLYSPYPKNDSRMITKFRNRGIYNPPGLTELHPEFRLLKEVSNSLSSNNVSFWIDKVAGQNNLLYIAGWAFPTKNQGDDAEIVVALKSPLKTLIFSTKPIERKGVQELFIHDYPYLKENLGFKLYLDKSKFLLPDQDYQIGVGIVSQGKIVALSYSDKVVNSSNIETTKNNEVK